MSPDTHLEVGDIVQLSQEARNSAFACCLMVVTDLKVFGARGYVQALGDSRETMGGQAYYRAMWGEMELTGGKAQWMPS